MEYIEPAVLDEDLLFRDVLGECETSHTKNDNRTHNLRLACEAINGLVLKPGETFSYNNTLGERTTAKDGTPTGRMGAGSFEAPVMAGVGPNELAADIGVNRVPRALVNNKESPYYKHGRNGGVKEPEPTGYDGQGLNSH